MEQFSQNKPTSSSRRGERTLFLLQITQRSSRYKNSHFYPFLVCSFFVRKNQYKFFVLLFFLFVCILKLLEHDHKEAFYSKYGPLVDSYAVYSRGLDMRKNFSHRFVFCEIMHQLGFTAIATATWNFKYSMVILIGVEVTWIFVILLVMPFKLRRIFWQNILSTFVVIIQLILITVMIFYPSFIILIFITVLPIVMLIVIYIVLPIVASKINGNGEDSDEEKSGDNPVGKLTEKTPLLKGSELHIPPHHNSNSINNTDTEKSSSDSSSDDSSDDSSRTEKSKKNSSEGKIGGTLAFNVDGNNKEDDEEEEDYLDGKNAENEPVVPGVLAEQAHPATVNQDVLPEPVIEKTDEKQAKFVEGVGSTDNGHDKQEESEADV